MAAEYARRVFIIDSLPVSMSVKSFLRMSVELGLSDLQQEIAKELIKQTKMAPHATAHSRSVNFFDISTYLLMSESLPMAKLIRGRCTQTCISQDIVAG